MCPAPRGSQAVPSQAWGAKFFHIWGYPRGTCPTGANPCSSAAAPCLAPGTMPAIERESLLQSPPHPAPSTHTHFRAAWTKESVLLSSLSALLGTCLSPPPPPLPCQSSASHQGHHTHTHIHTQAHAFTHVQPHAHTHTCSHTQRQTQPSLRPYVLRHLHLQRDILTRPCAHSHTKGLGRRGTHGIEG